jgi:glucose dehydrogenase
VFAAEGVAFALDAATGRELWRFTPDADASLGRSAADDGAFYFGTLSRRAYAVSVTDGSLLWSTQLGPEWQYNSPVKGVAVSGDTVYATIDRHYSQNGFYSAGVIVALDRSTGRELWRYQNGEGTDSRGIVGAPTVSGNLLLASDHKGNAFFAVNRFTGQQVWRTHTDPAFLGPGQAPIVIGNVAYASAIDTYVYAMDLQTGRVLWKTSPAMGGSTRHAVCGNAVFNNLQSLGITDRHTGRSLGLMFTEDERVTSGFAVHDERIFFVTHKAMYALKCP